MLARPTSIPTIALAAALVLASAGAADARLAGAAAPSVTFTATGPAGLKIVGTVTSLSIADDGQNVTLTVPLATLTTGITLRDKHMRDKYLEVQSFPSAQLRVPRAALRFPEGGATSTADAPGTMTIHGTPKPVSVHYTATRAGDRVHVEATVLVDMRDHGVVVPSYLGVTVKPNVEIAARFDAEET